MTRTAGEIREAVRERYAEAARSAAGGRPGCCSPSASSCGCGTEVPDACGDRGFGRGLYTVADQDALPERSKLASLGCGNPSAVAELRPGEIVLDLGSGGGIDVLLSARRVGPAGKAYGLDMTAEMLELARRNQREAGVENAAFLEGTIEEIPLPDSSVDVVISNCVINLSADKARTLHEAARVLRPAGRLAVTDVVADPDMDAATRDDLQRWTGCVAGALTEREFRRELAAAGFTDIEIEETHRVHDRAASAIVRAIKSG